MAGFLAGAVSYIIFAALGWCIDFLTTHGMPFLGPSEVMLNNSVRHQLGTASKHLCSHLCSQLAHVLGPAPAMGWAVGSVQGMLDLASAMGWAVGSAQGRRLTPLLSSMPQAELEVDNLHDASVGGHRAQKIIQVARRPHAVHDAKQATGWLSRLCLGLQAHQHGFNDVHYSAATIPH